MLGVPPWPALGLIPEVLFSAFAPDGRQAIGAFRVRGGRRIAVAVDPSMDPMEYVVEDALTGSVVRTGRVGERMNAADWHGRPALGAKRSPLRP